MGSKLRNVISLIACVTMVVSGLAGVLATSASAAQPSDPGTGMLPSAVPSAITPAVNNGRVFAITEAGNTMVIGGSFTQVGGSSHTHVAAFNKDTGALISGFNPSVNGDVNTIIPGPSTGTVYVGGTFTQVNGTSAQFLTLLNLSDGSIVTSFQPPSFNYGYVNDVVKRGNMLYVAGTFTYAGGKQHQGLVSLNATSGALDPFVGVQFTGHHNDTGSGAQGWVGPKKIDVSADGKTMVVIGNFKFADGQLRDQVAMLNLSGSSAQLADWSTDRYSPACYNWAFDSYMHDVSFSPDGSFFVIVTTGGGNVGTLCDAVTRFNTNLNATDAEPDWIDQAGGDTHWGVTVTSNVVYAGGHNRWMNNPLGVDRPRAGAVPRAGLEALDVETGRPYSWNPGRVPLGVGVFAFLATKDGVWLGSNTDYIGNYRYKRPKLAFFPYDGGYTPASTTTVGLPGTVYLGGLASSNALTTVDFDGTTATSSGADNQGIDFSNWRGAFLVGGTVFYGDTDGYLYSRTFDGTTFGPAVKIDPYNDPYWSDLQTGNGDTFRGAVPSLYRDLSNVTGMMYSQGRLYYTLSGDSRLYSRWFLPDSGIVDETTTTSTSSVNFSDADGMFVSGGKLYYASRTDGNLRSVSFNDGTVSGAPTVVSGPAVDGVSWKNRAMFLGSGKAVNQPPTALFTSDCTSLGCTFDATGSSDPDGSIASYSWDFGDGSTGTGKTPTHAYSAAGSYTVTLTVQDDDGASSAPMSVAVSVTNKAPTASFTVGCAGLDCSFNAAGSADPDGSIASYSWNFDDGDTGSGVHPSHTFSSAGTYSVVLTVTDEYGATDSVTKAVTVSATSGGVQFVAAADAGGGNTRAKQVDVPAAAQAGDTAVLFFSATSTSSWSGPSGVTGWDEVDSYTTGNLLTQVWVKSLDSGDLGGTVQFSSPAYSHASANIAVYSGVDESNPVQAFAHTGSAGATSHTTPTATADGGDFVVSLWGDRASGTVTWTPPAGLSSRDASTDTGNGLTVQALVADSGGPAAAGTVGGKTATTDISTSRSAAWTVVLNPAGATTPPPQANGVQFVAAADAGGGNTRMKQVSVPAAAQAGDTAVLFLTRTSTSSWSGPSGVTGWDEIDSFANGSLTTTAWVKDLDSDDLGGTVQFDSSGYSHASANIVVYSGVDQSSPVTAFAHAGTSGGTSHTTPTVAAGAGDYVVSFWGDRASGTVTWAPPAGLSARDASTDSGNGLTVQALIADSDGPVSAGTAGGKTATTDIQTGRTSLWTIALKAA